MKVLLLVFALALSSCAAVRPPGPCDGVCSRAYGSAYLQALPAGPVDVDVDPSLCECFFTDSTGRIDHEVIRLMPPDLSMEVER